VARTFDDVDDVIRWSIGGLSGTTANATIVAVLRRGSDTTFDTILGLHDSGGTAQQWLQIEDVDRLQFGHAAANQTSSFTVTSADGWVLVAAGKNAGSATPRFHKYVYSTGTWTHSNAGGTLTDGSSPGAGGYAETSQAGTDLFSGDLAAVAVYTGTNLTDAQVENLPFSLAHWHEAPPTAMWVLDQASTTQNVPDLTGGGAGQTSLTGTTVATSSVPVLGYGAPVLAPTVDVPDKTDTDSGTLTETESLLIDTPDTDTGTFTESESLHTSNVLWRVDVDWDNDGGFTDSYDDVTARTLERSGISFRYGRDQARALSPISPGEAGLELDNSSRDYSPDNLASPLYGKNLPARPVRIQASLEGTTYVLFRGHIDEYTLEPGVTELSTVDVGALDPLAMLKDAAVSTQLYQGIRTGTAIGHILDAIDWPAADRDLDPGAALIRWWWEEGTDAWEALQKLVASEGPGAFVHADTDGKIVFRDRHHRLTRAASTTAQTTFTATAEPKFTREGFSYDHGWRDIVNRITFKVDERDPGAELETVWESADVRSIAASSTNTIDVETDDPVINPTVSYTTLTGSVSAAIVQSSGQKLSLELTAGGSAAAVSNLVVSAQPVTVQRTYQVTVEDAASIAKYGQRTLPSGLEAPWAGVHDAGAIADLIVGQRAERLPIVTIRLKSGTTVSSTRLVQQLSRDLSDRVHVREDETQVDHDFFIEQIKHDVPQAGLVLETVFGLERTAVHPSNVFTFDKAGAGFDDGVFGATGLDDPRNIFRFDVAGQGFDDGVFAT
jgi:hypothetical protein